MDYIIWHLFNLIVALVVGLTSLFFTPQESNSLPEPVETGLSELKEISGELFNSVLIVDPETQFMWHVVDESVRKQYRVSTGHGSLNTAGKIVRLGNVIGSHRTPVGYMTTIGSEATVCDMDEIGAQWTTTSCFGRYATVDQTLPKGERWQLTRELTTVILRMYSQEARNSNSVARGILIHGTNHYDSVYEQYPDSWGCIRLLPDEILDLAEHLDDDVNQIYILDREWRG
jgi:hypothetical protein